MDHWLVLVAILGHDYLLIDGPRMHPGASRHALSCKLQTQVLQIVLIPVVTVVTEVVGCKPCVHRSTQRVSLVKSHSHMGLGPVRLARWG